MWYAAPFPQRTLWLGQCALWHSLPQYQDTLQPLHRFDTWSLVPQLEQRLAAGNAMRRPARLAWLAGWLAGWRLASAGWLAGWLTGWLAGWLASQGSFLSLVLANIKNSNDRQQKCEYEQGRVTKVKYYQKWRIHRRTKMVCFPLEIQQL